MNIELVNKLKNSVNFFDDAEFVSLVSENEVLIRNTANGAEWLVPFEINESGILLYKGAEAECITEADDEYSEETKHNKNVRSVMEAITSIFENKDEGIEKLSTLIKTLPLIEKTEEVVSEEVAQPELTYFKEFEDRLEEYNSLYEEFMLNGKVFDEDGDIRLEDFYEASVYKKPYEDKAEKAETFLESLETYKTFCEEVQATFEEDVAKVIIESIDFTKPKNKFNMLVAKNLVQFKQDTLSDINILDESKKAVSIFEETLGQLDGETLITEMTATDMRESYYANRFTRFNIGIFKREDLVKINEELTAAMTSSDIDTPEDMHYINDLKMKIEYMERANQIDDELVVNIINEFNTRFGKDKSAQYRDDRKSLGWKNPGAQKITSLDITGV